MSGQKSSPYSNTSINPHYRYPDDPMETLVRDADSNGRFSYLSTVCRKMRRRLEDKAMMSQTNFRKNHGHE